MNSYFAFITAVQLGSFTKAAEQLGYTQSAISQLILSLEKELDTKLIIRSRAGLELTADGHEYLPYIQQICQKAMELEEKKKVMQGLERGVIKMGIISSIATNFLPHWVKEFKENYPTVQFEFYMGDYSEIERMILNGVVDFGFVNPKVVTSLSAVPLIQDEMVACVPIVHPLSELENVTLNQLAEESFILIQEGSRSNALQLFTESGLEPKVDFIVQDDYTVIEMIAAGLGVTIIPSLVLRYNDERVHTMPLNPPSLRTISLAYKDLSILPIASRKFILFIEEAMKAENV